MLDLEPRLDSRLRSFYEHIEAQTPPRTITSFEGPLRHTRRRTLNLVAAVAGVAVVAAGLSVFGAELAGHHGAKPPAPASRPSDPYRLLPPAAQITAGLPSVSHTVIHFRRGTGSASLPTFTPEGIIFIVFSCVGSGSINVHSTNNLVGSSAPACSRDGGVVYGATVPLSFVPPIHGKPLSLEITAGPSVAWEVAVADSGPVVPLPALAAATRPAGAHVIVAMTYGVGTSSVETLYPPPSGPYYVQYACTGAGTVDISTSDGSRNWVSQDCANGAVRTQMGAKPTSSGPINLTFEVAPRTLWEAVIYELPSPKS